MKIWKDLWAFPYHTLSFTWKNISLTIIHSYARSQIAMYAPSTTALLTLPPYPNPYYRSLNHHPNFLPQVSSYCFILVCSIFNWFAFCPVCLCFRLPCNCSVHSYHRLQKYKTKDKKRKWKRKQNIESEKRNMNQERAINKYVPCNCPIIHIICS